MEARKEEWREEGREGGKEVKEELDKYLGLLKSKPLSSPLYKMLS